MKILDLFPWVADEELIKYEKEFLPDDVDVYGLKSGIQEDCHGDLVATMPETINAIIDAEKKGYDAVVVACFGDIGVEAGRAHVGIPIVGPTKVALHVAAMIGHRICLLVPEFENLELTSRQLIEQYGFQDNTFIRGSYVPVTETIKAYEKYKETDQISPFIKEMVGICEKSIEEDDIDGIILGCGGIKWMKHVLESELGKKGYDIRVINPLQVAIEFARLLVTVNLSHNRRGYPTPAA